MVPYKLKPLKLSSIMSLSSGNQVFQETVGKLAPFAELADGWDGDDSMAPSDNMLGMAVRFAAKVADAHLSSPYFMIFHDGQLGCYWKTDRYYVSVTFHADGEYTWVIAFGSSMSSGEWGENDPLPPEITGFLQYHESGGESASSFQCYDGKMLSQIQVNQIKDHPFRYRWLLLKWHLGLKGEPCQCSFHELSHYDMDKEYDHEDYPCLKYRPKNSP